MKAVPPSAGVNRIRFGGSEAAASLSAATIAAPRGWAHARRLSRERKGRLVEDGGELILVAMAWIGVGDALGAEQVGGPDRAIDRRPGEREHLGPEYGIGVRTEHPDGEREIRQRYPDPQRPD